MGHNHNKLNKLLNGTSSLYHPSKEKSSDTSKPLWKCLLSEFVGTFLLIFIGCGSGIHLNTINDAINNGPESQLLVGKALCWAFVIATLAQSLAHISCDMNPAVTLALLVTGRTTIVKAISFILIQTVGCTCGAYVLKLVMPPQLDDNYGMTTLSPLINPLQGVIIEVIATFLLVFTVFGTNDDGRKDLKGSMPLSVGFCVAGIVLAVGPLTGASLNPSRSFGPSLVAKNFANHWIYWVGPICGGLIGGVLYHMLYDTPEVKDDREDGREIQGKENDSMRTLA